MSLLNPYCTVAQVQELIHNNASSVTSKIEDAINAASRWIDEYKGRDYFEHDYSSTALVINAWSGSTFGEILFVGIRPVIEITEVKVCGTVWTVNLDYLVQAETGELVSLTGYWIGQPTRSTTAARWVAAFRNSPTATVEIKGRFGYAQRTAPVAPATLGTIDHSLVPAGMPAHITTACVQIAAALSRLNNRDVVGLDGQKVGILETDVPKSALMLLGNRAKLMI